MGRVWLNPAFAGALLLLVITERAPAHPTTVSDPLEARIERSDVALFWQSFDRLMADPNATFDDYLAKGSAGVRLFIPDERIKSADALKELVLSEKDYYRAIRQDSLTTSGYDTRIRAAFLALKNLYPRATFPTTYYVIGRTTSGGGGYPGKPIVVGIETLSRRSLTTAYGRPSLPMDLLPEIIAHEIIHYLQAPEPAQQTLLESAYREGAADFVAELTVGTRVLELNGKDVYPYGDAHRERLLGEFLAHRGDPSLGRWLYGEPEPGRPQNLGYWAGYQIAKAFYDRQTDKRRAIAEIIRPRGGAASILSRSGLLRGKR